MFVFFYGIKMLLARDVLEWPYASDLPIMDPSVAYCTKNLPIFTFEGIREKTELRKTFNFQKEMQAGIGAYLSNYDRARGHKAETDLAKKLFALDYKCYELSHSDNYFKHIDIEVECPNGKHVWLDVKAPNCLRKGRCTDPLSTPQDRFVCLQIGPKSTLYGGLSDYIVFSTTKGEFLVAKKTDLVTAIELKMSSALKAKERSAWPETALWIPYVRTFNDYSTVSTYMDLNDLPILGKL
jgi:hypothetical protein